MIFQRMGEYETLKERRFSAPLKRPPGLFPLPAVIAIVFVIVIIVVIVHVLIANLIINQVVLLVLFTFSDPNWLDIGLKLKLRVQALIHVVLVCIA